MVSIHNFKIFLIEVLFDTRSDECSDRTYSTNVANIYSTSHVSSTT